jgi:signal transduction histidine kinase
MKLSATKSEGLDIKVRDVAVPDIKAHIDQCYTSREIRSEYSKEELADYLERVSRRTDFFEIVRAFSHDLPLARIAIEVKNIKDKIEFQANRLKVFSGREIVPAEYIDSLDDIETYARSSASDFERLKAAIAEGKNVSDMIEKTVNSLDSFIRLDYTLAEKRRPFAMLSDVSWHNIFIGSEERYLKEKFGKDFSIYAQQLQSNLDRFSDNFYDEFIVPLSDEIIRCGDETARRIHPVLHPVGYLLDTDNFRVSYEYHLRMRSGQPIRVEIDIDESSRERLMNSFPAIDIDMVIANLIKNSKDHAFSEQTGNPTITIKCRYDSDNTAAFYFADNGKGVGDSDLLRIIDRFDIKSISPNTQRQMQLAAGLGRDNNPYLQLLCEDGISRMGLYQGEHNAKRGQALNMIQTKLFEGGGSLFIFRPVKGGFGVSFKVPVTDAAQRLNY